MIRLARLIMQWSLLPPININFNFPPRRYPPPPPQTPKPNGFDPARKVDDREARILATSNGLEKPK
jgi:hypothetical protein